jgi:hypothetical protein
MLLLLYLSDRANDETADDNKIGTWNIKMALGKICLKFLKWFESHHHGVFDLDNGGMLMEWKWFGREMKLMDESVMHLTPFSSLVRKLKSRRRGHVMCFFLSRKPQAALFFVDMKKKI